MTEFSLPPIDLGDVARPLPGAMTGPSAGPTVLPPADLLPIHPRATWAFRLARATIGPIVRSLVRLDCEGWERRPRGAHVLISNHLGWIDSFAILLTFPSEPRIHFLGAPEALVHRPFQWWVIRHVGGFVPVDRKKHGDTTLFSHVHRCLERGAVVALYPEGRCGPAEGSLLAFKKGFAHFAKAAGVPVLPVALSGTRDLWFRKRLRVIVGEPIATEGLGIDELTEAGRRRVAALLPPPPAEPPGPKLLRHWLTNLL